MLNGDYELGMYKDICPKCGSRIIDEQCEGCPLTNRFMEKRTSGKIHIACELLAKLTHLTLAGQNDEGQLEWIGTDKQWEKANG